MTGRPSMPAETITAVRARPVLTLLMTLAGAAAAAIMANRLVPATTQATVSLTFCAPDNASASRTAALADIVREEEARAADSRFLTRVLARCNATKASLTPDQLAASIRTQMHPSGPTVRLDVIVERPLSAAAAPLADRLADVCADELLVGIHERDETRHREQAAAAQRRVDQARDALLRPAEAALQAFINKLEHPADLDQLERMSGNNAREAKTTVAQDAAAERARLDARLTDLRARRDALLGCIPIEARPPKSPAALSAEQLDAHRPQIAREWTDARPVLADLVSRIAAMEARRAQLDARYTPANREVKDAREELSAARRLLLNELAAMADAAGADIAALAARREQLAAEERSQQLRTATVARLWPEFQRLRDQLTAAHQQHDAVRRSASDAAANAAESPSAFSVRRLGGVTVQRSMGMLRTPVLLATALSVLASLCVAGLLCLWLDRHSPAVRSAADARRRLGLPVLAAIPHQPRGLWPSGQRRAI